MKIARLLIDGYNVIGIYHRNMRAVREEFIKQLVEYKKIKGHDITVVFDAHGGTSKTDTSSVTGGIRVIFSAINKKADDVIKEILKKDRSTMYIVISSDREIVKAAWASSSVPVPSDVFLKKLEEALGLSEEYDEDDEPYTLKKKRQLSKKQKAILRAVRKL